MTPLLALGLAVLLADYADTPAEKRREDKAEHLLNEHFATWPDEIAGFNRRNAGCDADAAQAAATYDAAHHATFKRTLGWRYDDAAARWVPAPPKQAQVALIYSGPVRSGTATLGGKTQSFCRAEAPDEIETRWVKEFDGDGNSNTFGTSYPLPALVPGFDAPGVTEPPVGVGSSTSRDEITARIGKATVMLAQDVDGLDAFVVASRLANACPEAKANEMAKRFAGIGSTRTRTAGPVKVELSGRDYFGPRKEGDRTTWLCGAISPKVTIKATTSWQAEGENQLSFTVEAQGKP